MSVLIRLHGALIHFMIPSFDSMGKGLLLPNIGLLLQIPKMHMEATPETFVHLLAEAGFVPQAGRTPTGKRKDSGTPITPRSSIKRLTAFHTASSKFSAWKQPHTLSKLLFDTDALLEVLENGKLCLL